MIVALATVIMICLMFVPGVNILAGIFGGLAVGGPIGAVIGGVVGFFLTSLATN